MIAAAAAYEKDIILNNCQADFFESQGMQIDQDAVFNEPGCTPIGKTDVRGAAGKGYQRNEYWDSVEKKYLVHYYFEEGYENTSYDARNRAGWTRHHTGAESIAQIVKYLGVFETRTCIKAVRITPEQARTGAFDQTMGTKTVGPVKIRYDEMHPHLGKPANKPPCTAGPGNDWGINMRADCWPRDGNTRTQHEFMHVLGFYHEQQREDRDGYVVIHENLLNNTAYMKISEVQKQQLGAPTSRTEFEDDDGTPYDFDSVMQYSSADFKDDKNIKKLQTGLARLGINDDTHIPEERAFPLSKWEWL